MHVLLISTWPLGAPGSSQKTRAGHCCRPLPWARQCERWRNHAARKALRPISCAALHSGHVVTRAICHRTAAHTSPSPSTHAIPQPKRQRHRVLRNVRGTAMAEGRSDQHRWTPPPSCPCLPVSPGVGSTPGVSACTAARLLRLRNDGPLTERRSEKSERGVMKRGTEHRSSGDGGMPCVCVNTHSSPRPSRNTETHAHVRVPSVLAWRSAAQQAPGFSPSPEFLQIHGIRECTSSGSGQATWQCPNRPPCTTTARHTRCSSHFPCVLRSPGKLCSKLKPAC